MQKNILHLHLSRTGGKSIVSSILRSKKYDYIQASKIFTRNLRLNTNKDKMDDLLYFLRSNKQNKPLFVTGHVDLNPYFYFNNYKIFTILRNPLDRFKSHLSAVIDTPQDKAYKEILENFKSIDSFLKYPLDSIAKINQSNLSTHNKETLLLFMSNGQSRQIANIPYNVEITDSDLLDITLEKLSKIDLISTSENLNLNFPLLKIFLNLPFYYHLPEVNISNSNKFNNEINNEFYKLNKIDFFIWKSISIFERNYYKNKRKNILYELERYDKYLFDLLKPFKIKLLNILGKY